MMMRIGIFFFFYIKCSMEKYMVCVSVLFKICISKQCFFLCAVMVLIKYMHHQVVQKLKALKGPLRKLIWQNGNLHGRLRVLRKELDLAQSALDGDPSNVFQQEKKSAILGKYKDALLDKEKFLKQKAKVDWLHEGDQNTGYFTRR